MIEFNGMRATKVSPENEKVASRKGQKEKEELKRPGSAVSREFMPKKQQNVANTWKKHEDHSQQQPAHSIYGYVPFKTTPLPIYGVRTTTPQPLNPADYMHSIYAPPQALRPESAAPRDGVQRQESRPGSEMGMYRPSSRYQSYTTLPRPEIVDVEEMPPPQFRQIAGEVYGTNAMHGGTPRSQQSTQPGKQQMAEEEMAKIPRNRTPSLMNATNPIRTAEHFPQPFMHNKALYNMSQAKFGYASEPMEVQSAESIIPWNKMHILSGIYFVIGLGLLVVGTFRMFHKADYGKGLDVFCGIAAITAAILGYGGAKRRSYSMANAFFVLSLINVGLAIATLTSAIVPLLQLIEADSEQSFGSGVFLEAYTALAFISVLLLSVAIATSIFGFQSIGQVVEYVELYRQEFIHRKNDTQEKLPH